MMIGIWESFVSSVKGGSTLKVKEFLGVRRVERQVQGWLQGLELE
jgi:hypothetical protein